MNAWERMYTLGKLADPVERAKMRLAACARHEADILQGGREGAYDHLTVEQWFEQVVMEHSNTIDRFYDRGGWRNL